MFVKHSVNYHRYVACHVHVLLITMSPLKNATMNKYKLNQLINVLIIVRAHVVCKTRLSSQESERSCICV